MKVLIDAKEKTRIQPALKYFNKNNTATVEDLPIGDYIFINEKDNKQCAFEYKTCSDFITSVQEHRVFNQAIDQSTHFDYHFVCLEYTDDLRKTLSEELYYNQNIIFTKAQFYGAIARLNTYTTVISAHNNKTCFELMEKQAKKCFDDSTIIKSLKKATDNSAMNYLTNCCIGIGKTTAENITGDLKLLTLQDLLNLDKPMLLSVNGVGEKTANRILSNIKKDSDELV